MNFDPRENWRIVLLVVMLFASGILLFVPGIGLGATNAPAEDSGGLVSTNLQFGLDLSGGTRVRAPLVGLTATGVDPGNVSTIENRVAERLDNVSSDGDLDFFARRNDDRAPAIEVRANISETAFRAALDAAGVEYSGIQPGVARETRQTVVQVIRSKIDESGLADRTVQSSFSAGDGRYYVLIEVPNQNRSEVLDLVNTRGSVRIDAYHSVQRGNETVWVNRTVLERGTGPEENDFRNVGIPTRTQQLGPHVPVSIKDSVAPQFQQDMVETGIAQRSSTVCGWPGDPNFDDAPPRGAGEEKGPCLLTIADDEVVYSAGMDGDLGGSMVDETWASDPQFVLQTSNLSEASDLQINLQAGALPTKLNIDAGTTSFVAPSLAENFKLFSLLTGIIAVLAVAVMVFLRYGNPRVAAPMVVTALSEVFILLGFASAVGLALDLSHVAGFIAVIGTGVDDLIIIADEVLSEGEVGGGRVFQSRFRKAFWVIGAAAATTIIAMGPLAFLQLGDLRGFAIVTILGVLIGILVTRPAYGDILRSLMSNR